MTSSKVAALTGKPGVGKTTAMIKVANLLTRDGVGLAGFYSREVRVKGIRVGFELVDIVSGDVYELAWAKQGHGPRVGKYLVNIANVEKMARQLVGEISGKCDAVLVDEVGPMELLSKGFVDAVETILHGGKPSLFTVHYAAKHPLVTKLKELAGQYLFTLDFHNRDAIPGLVYSVMKGWLKD
ncbi:MAG: NTPase [Candidatus Caldarchaeum sp.]|nr:NTPase [Candidatus Caldarchaeum sp.]MCS7133802.1 NTPase [Candidatus Caldarchaeum sp.]MDW8062946.1 NTPase [Candidatus Caldarchaeum sp.]MDW8435729.1 NTPase [Candidatus Caldarchaeum sp.]